MREICKSRHLGPFSVGVYHTGQFRCENCDAVLSGVEVYLDTTENAEMAKRFSKISNSLRPHPTGAIPPVRGASRLGPLGSTS
jgi:hypothetical protein